MNMHWNIVYRQKRGSRGLVRVSWAATHNKKEAMKIAAKVNNFDLTQIIECKISAF